MLLELLMDRIRLVFLMLCYTPRQISRYATGKHNSQVGKKSYKMLKFTNYCNHMLS